MGIEQKKKLLLGEPQKQSLLVFSKKADCQQTVLAFNKDASVCCAISYSDEGQFDTIMIQKYFLSRAIQSCHLWY